MTTKHENKISGFTLVETLVAITILLVGVIGPLAIASRGIADGLFAQNQITANYLAQEALEVFINQRNRNVRIAGADWLDNGIRDCLPAPAGSGAECSVDPKLGTITTCSSAPCDIVYDLVDEEFQDVSDVPEAQRGSPIFTRSIEAEGVPSSAANPESIKVSVKLEWRNRLTPRDFTITAYLYDKRDNY